MPNATIELYDGEIPQMETRTAKVPTGDLVGQADSEGIIKINVTSLKILGKKKLTAVVSDEEGNKAVFPINILPKKRTDYRNFRYKKTF